MTPVTRSAAAVPPIPVVSFPLALPTPRTAASNALTTKLYRASSVPSMIECKRRYSLKENTRLKIILLININGKLMQMNPDKKMKQHLH